MQNVNNSFSTVTNAARSAAREERLIIAVGRVEADSYRDTQSFNSSKDSITKEIAELEKEALVAEFAVTSTTTENPLYAELVESAKTTRSEVDAEKAELQKELDKITANYTKSQEDFATKIADLEAGKISVDYDKVIARSKELIKEKVAAQFLAGDFDSSTE